MFDKLLLPNDFNEIDTLLERLIESNVLTLEIIDLGLFYYIKKKYPQFNVIYANKTANLNIESRKAFYLGVQGDEVPLENNLSYAPRNYAKELEKHGIDLTKVKYIKDSDHPEYKLCIKQNKDGFFLYPQITEQLKEKEQNLDVRRLSKYQKRKVTGKYLGIVLDSLPSKWLTISIKKPIKLGRKIKFLTTENKLHELAITEIKDLCNNLLTSASKNKIIRIKSNRQVLPRTLII